MNGAVLLLFLINFACVGILPLVFFTRSEGLNLMWWMTAAPYFLSPAFLVLSFVGTMSPLTGYGTVLSQGLTLVAVVLSVASVGLIAYTLGTHRLRITLWHQTNDAPQHIVTFGAYSRIRHPFYTAFQLALLGALIFCPQLGTLATFVYGLIIMNHTAIKEEKRLCESEFGAEYQAYMQRTGRFMPRWRRQPK